MKWATAKLGELGSFRNGLNYTSANHGSGLRVINVADFKDRSFPEYDSLGEIDPQGVAGENDLLADGDIVFVRSNGNRDLVGRSLLIQRLPAAISHSAFTIRLRLASEKVSPKFLSYFFRSPLFRKHLSLQGAGTNICNLNQGILAGLDVPLPQRLIQDAVSDILSAYDDAIENNRRRMALLEKAARLLYEEWFVRLRFPGHEHTPASNGIPQGWAKKPLGELADVVMGQSPESKFHNKSGEGFPFHQGVADFGDRFVTNRVFTTVENRIAFPGDILCSVRAPVGRLNITLDKIVIGRGLAALRCLSGYQSFFLYQLNTHFFKEDLIGSGAIFASVTKAEFKNQKMLTPTEHLIRAFEDVTVPIDDQLRVLYLQNQKLRAARDLLLPRLMSGEIAL